LFAQGEAVCREKTRERNCVFAAVSGSGKAVGERESALGSGEAANKWV